MSAAAGQPPASRHLGGPFVGGRSVGSAEALLRRLDLAVTRRLDGVLQGDHLGLVGGPGSEPGDARAYALGDDVRRIDWNVTARTSVAHVRLPVADRELETWVVADLSPSLDFGTADCEKRDLVAAAVAAVGHLTAGTGNRIGGLLLGERVQRVPPRPGRAHLLGLVHEVQRAPRRAGASADLADTLTELRRLARRRGLVVVVSDFLGQDGWHPPLRALAVGHDVVTVEVVDRRELELPNVGVLALVDPETGRRLEVDTASRKLRDRYAEAAAHQRDEIRRKVRSAGADHLVLRTDRDWLGDLVGFVERRRRRQRGRTARG